MQIPEVAKYIKITTTKKSKHKRVLAPTLINDLNSFVFNICPKAQYLVTTEEFVILQFRLF